MSDDYEEPDDSGSDYDPDFDPDPEAEENSVHQNRMKLPTLARAVQRNFIADRAAAELATSAILDFVAYHKLKIPESSFIIDKSKIRREVNKLIRNAKKLGFSEKEKWGLYFDGKRDNTIVNKKDEKSKTYHIRSENQEHITLVKEPVSKFITFVTAEAGDANTISSAIFNKLEDQNIPMHNLVAIGADGTNVNTGWFLYILLLDIFLQRVNKLHFYYTASQNTDFIRTCEK